VSFSGDLDLDLSFNVSGDTASKDSCDGSSTWTGVGILIGSGMMARSGLM
jgi:hypothetical protein